MTSRDRDALCLDACRGTGKPSPAPTPREARPTALRHWTTRRARCFCDGPTAREQRLTDRDLRLACQCAQCRDEMSGKRLLDPENVPLHISLTRVWSVGNYALGMAFSDGHDTGIYTFKALRGMAGTELEDV